MNQQKSHVWSTTRLNTDIQPPSKPSNAGERRRVLDACSSTSEVRANSKLLDPAIKSSAALKFETELSEKIIGQPDAIDAIAHVYQTLVAGLSPVNRPIAVLLFSGPTGVGKTRCVEASAEIIFGNPHAFSKYNCGEYQLPHEIAKLTGSPPGYLGFKETHPLLSQAHIDRFQTEAARFDILLFDEIEKANETLWQLLLGVLDKATLTLGDGSETNFSQSIIFMTTNLGAREIEKFTNGSWIGFKQPDASAAEVASITAKAAHTRFTPEFLNRIDRNVVLRKLDRQDFLQILELELSAVQNRILASSRVPAFAICCTGDARAFLVNDGTVNSQYGARELKRTIEQHIVLPLSNLISTSQIAAGDIITIDFSKNDNALSFYLGPR